MQDNTPFAKPKFTWQVLIILSTYRLVVWFILFFIYLSFFLNGKVLRIEYPILLGISLAYFLFACYQLFQSFGKRIEYSRLAISGVFIDILFFALLSFANVHFLILYGILMNIAIAAGSIIVAGRMSLFFASWAAICVLVTQLYLAIIIGNISLLLVQNTGFLCVTFFVIAIITFSLSRRIRQSELLAQQRGEDIAALEKINDLIVENMHHGVLVIDEQDRIVSSNKAAWYLLGAAKRSGKPILSDISHPLMHSVHLWRSGNTNETTTQHLAEIGVTPQFTSLTGANGKRKATLIIMEDAAEVSKHAQQIKLASLGRLTASIAHEIRNPLSAISHAAQLLAEELSSPNSKKLIDIIKNNSIRVNEIIENILKLSRRKESIAQSINLEQWLNQFKEQLMANYSKPVKININANVENAIIAFDSQQLQQILENICDNGFTYSENATGIAEISMFLGQDKSSNTVYLDIIDRGHGIPAENIEFIFEPFYTTRTGGTGLGLYIARELCQANGAKIIYFNLPETGSCFRIFFKKG